jgi:DHA2 family multidrug resistance protein
MAQAIMADSFDENKARPGLRALRPRRRPRPLHRPTLGGWITDSYSWRWIFYINIPVGILAYILVTRWSTIRRGSSPTASNLLNIDYIGLGFLTLAMGGLQIMLDKGEENDWFASNFIRFFGFMFVIGMVGLIVWEWRKDPLINLRSSSTRTSPSAASS